MPEADLHLLIDAVHGAGDIATRYSGQTAKRWDKPDGAGPVTEADLAVNDFLFDYLRGARPDYGWLSEETEDDSDRLTRERVFVVDPIDGTRSFADGARTWAHSVAVLENGVPVAAAVFLPLRGLLYAASAGGGATLNDREISVTAHADLATAHMLATRVNMQPEHWKGDVPAFKRDHRPSLAYRMCLVAQGRFDGMLTFRPTWEWDIAAGELILREAGAICSDKAGQQLRFNNPHPTVNGVIAANPGIHDALTQSVQS